jgi:hypothetical protein
VTPSLTASVGETSAPFQVRELFMVGARRGWALGQAADSQAEQVLVTTDGGDSWQIRTPAGVPAGDSLEQTISASATFASASRGWVAYLLPAPIPEDAAPVVWTTEDGGECLKGRASFCV